MLLSKDFECARVISEHLKLSFSSTRASSNCPINTPYIVGKGLKSTKKENLIQDQENESIKAQKLAKQFALLPKFESIKCAKMCISILCWRKYEFFIDKRFDSLHSTMYSLSKDKLQN